jgi:alpha-D-ribose 1-methylphosphonate 5-triphosphate synthase subunit PhnG
LTYREILAEGNSSVWESLSQRLAERYEIKMIQEPETCLIMMPVKDSVENSMFYLGEILITEAVVDLGGTQGYGFALEDRPEHALACAVIDAALSHGVQESTEIRLLLEQQKSEIEQKTMLEKRMIASTRVNFALLEG